MPERSSIFDMIGPVMIGPSSSHTAGVARIGRMARKILQQPPEVVTLTFYNSFATTFEGHGSDRAVMAGLLDMAADDERLRDAMDIAREEGIEIHIRAQASAPKLHPNTVRVQVTSRDFFTDVLGISRGGGLITISEIDGFLANLIGKPDTLLILARDVKGSVAYITSIIANDACNIATMTVSRRARNNDAMLIMEMDSPIRTTTLSYLSTLDWVKQVIYIDEMN